MHELTKVFQIIWETGKVTQDMKDANIVNLFKHKGDISDCANYRGIALLSVAGKILARVMLNRLILHISEKNLPESQCGFRSNRSTIDMVFTIRQIQEKCREQNMNLCSLTLLRPSTL